MGPPQPDKRCCVCKAPGSDRAHLSQAAAVKRNNEKPIYIALVNNVKYYQC